MSINHVLFFTKDFNHPQIESAGGTGSFYYELAKQINEKGIKVSVFGIGKRNQHFKEGLLEVKMVKDYFKSHLIMDLLRSISKKNANKESLHFKVFEKEKRWLNKELQKFINTLESKPKIIETHDFNGLAMSLQNLNIPYVVRCHGSWTVLEQYFGYQNIPKGQKYCEEKAFKLSRNFISISQSSQKMNEETFGIQNPKLIYNGIDTDYFITKSNAEIIKNSIFLVGKISKEKGSDKALNSFLKIKKQIPDASLHFIGDNRGFVEHLKQVAIEHNVENSVFFYGQKNKSEVKELLSKAEIVYFLSSGENFSLALLEAMAMKKTVICSNIPSYLEIIDDGRNGFICSNIDEVAEKTITLFNNRDFLKNLSEQAEKTIKLGFDLKEKTNETLAFYDEILKNQN